MLGASFGLESRKKSIGLFPGLKNDARHPAFPSTALRERVRFFGFAPFDSAQGAKPKGACRERVLFLSVSLCRSLSGVEGNGRG